MNAAAPAPDPAAEALAARLRARLEALVQQAPENRLPDFGGQPIFQCPLMGVADGDDPLFLTFRDVVHPQHLQPREILTRSAPGRLASRPVRVVAWVLPYTPAIRMANRGRDVPAALYSVARNNAGALNDAVSRRLATELQAAGVAVAIPANAPDYTALRASEHAFTSTWSERHVAFAAGLGRFGLNAALITAAGISVRLGSLVCDLPLPVTARLATSYRSPCLASRGTLCNQCMKRCPVQAISADGLNQSRCNEMRHRVRDLFLADYQQRYSLLPAPVVKNGIRKNGFSLGCALCQCGVPCESCTPVFPATEVPTCST